MKVFVIDASVAIKWVIEEAGTPHALSLRQHRLIAPDLLVAECANVLWKKVRRKELSLDEAVLASRLLARADVELAPMRPLSASPVGRCRDFRFRPIRAEPVTAAEVTVPPSSLLRCRGA